MRPGSMSPTLAMTSVMRRSVPASSPFTTDSHAAVAARAGPGARLRSAHTLAGRALSGRALGGPGPATTGLTAPRPAIVHRGPLPEHQPDRCPEEPERFPQLVLEVALIAEVDRSGI